MKALPIRQSLPAPATSHHALTFISVVAVGLGILAGFIAPALTHLIGFVTNLAFYGRISTAFISPAENRLGLGVVLIPVLGGIIVGLMARFGSKAIRGHGIPEAMEQVLENNSRIPARITFLKPVSAAIAIGTGGPFGAEGPIIATGGALGSVAGQALSTTAAERKTLLAAGAAAGMAAIFGSPISAILLAIELLLFEYRARSIIPVALAAVAAAGMRIHFDGATAIFAMPDIAPVSLLPLGLYALIGLILGVASVGVTRSVYWIEDMFEHLPIHWMWWPAIGGIAVGVIGYFAPRTLGVGYNNISDIISARLPLQMMAFLCAMKFVSWAIALSSGTSGGTLAPLLTIGGGGGGLVGAFLLWLMPSSGLDVRVAALVGMAAMFAGASRALLASVVFAFETTLQPNGLLPVLAGSTLGFFVARLLMQNSIMTEKIARRGLRIPQDYDADAFAQTTVSEIMDEKIKTLPAQGSVAELADLIARHDPEVSAHQAWPLLDSAGQLAGVITRSDLLRAIDRSGGRETSLIEAGNSALVVAHPDESVSDAVARMLSHGVGRLPVVSRTEPKKLIGYVSRTSLLSARLASLQQETMRDDGWFRSWKR
ncbi:MAG TPA: chloride channel protein [Opitutaceae bacterium]|jgi:CIC family chloride channel protein|nr:chloride channel protein [Opitutaceae bacterium]